MKLEKTITFTPSAAGSCEIFFHTKGGEGSWSLYLS